MPLPEISAIHERFLSISRVARERFSGSLAHRFLLRAGFDLEGVAVVASASIAGAASLCVDANPSLLREGLRAGTCDFVVATLDEALRLLKNELRQGRAIAVALAASPEESLGAMIERGLQPDLLSFDAHHPPQHAALLTERGSLLLSPPYTFPGTALLEWSIPGSPRPAPQSAAIAATVLDPTRDDTPARRLWLDRSPRYLGRAFGSRQVLRMTAPEAVAFISQLHREFPGVQLTRDGLPA